MALVGPGSDIVLAPGDFHFGAGGRISTLLGSCVAITFWHPARRVGGMCHYLLPSRRAGRGDGRGLDGRYAEDAVEMFRREILAVATAPEEYHVKMFGGGTQFSRGPNGNGIDVPGRNIEIGLRLLADLGLDVVSRHLGGSGARQVTLDVDSGEVLLRYRGLLPDEPAMEAGTRWLRLPTS